MAVQSLKVHSLGLFEAVFALARHHELIWELTKREIRDRYAGQALGLFWAVGHPVIMMGVYVFIFAIVFRAKIGGTADLPLDYSAYLLAGLVPWLTFQESMSKGATVIVTNANLVKQVIFPLEALPVKTVLSSTVTQVIATAVLVVYVLISTGSLTWTYLLLPVLFLFQALAMIGVCFVLGPVGAYLRDLKEVVQLFALVGLYLMPVVYLPEWVPSLLRPLLYLNPFSYLIWCYQDACYFGRFAHPAAWVLFPLGSLVTFYVGFKAFMRVKQSIGNFV